MNVESSLETDAQLAEPCKPGVGSLNHPAIATEAIAAFDALASNACSDSPLSQVASAARIIVAFVRVQLVGSLSWSSIQPRYRRDRIERAFERYRIVPVRSSDRDCQRDASCIYDDVTFAAEFSPVSRVGAGFLAPRGLATLAPSILARL